MKNFKKISFGEDNNLNTLSRIETDSVMGGAGIDGYCYFECLAYTSSAFNCNYSGGGYDTSYYMNQYGQQYGYSGVKYGPSSYNDCTNFAQCHFGAAQITTSSIQNAKNVGYQVMATYTTYNSNGVKIDHAVMIVGQWPGGTQYMVFDPSTGKNYTINANQINYALALSSNTISY